MIIDFLFTTYLKQLVYWGETVSRLSLTCRFWDCFNSLLICIWVYYKSIQQNIYNKSYTKKGYTYDTKIYPKPQLLSAATKYMFEITLNLFFDFTPSYCYTECIVI